MDDWGVDLAEISDEEFEIVRHSFAFQAATLRWAVERLKRAVYMAFPRWLQRLVSWWLG